MRASAESSRVVDATPSTVYGILSDYETEHPKILPKPYFEALIVEAGGRGTGTVIRVDMKVMGVRQTQRLKVSEPEPGRVLEEQDVDTGMLTTFTVEPVDDGRRSRVRIATVWPSLNLVNRFLVPRIARTIYTKELAILNEYASRL